MENLINQFRICAEERWKYLELGDSKNGNKYFNELTKIADELRSESKLEELSVLLDDLDDGVKFEAASKLLSINYAKAEEILVCLTKKKGVLPFTARQTLKQWKSCNI